MPPRWPLQYAVNGRGPVSRLQPGAGQSNPAVRL